MDGREAHVTVELVPASIDDVARVTSLINESEAFDGVQRVLDPDELLEEWSSEHIDLARDARLAFVDGRLAGWMVVDHQRSDAVQERAFLDGTVAPQSRGSGVGRALFAWGLPLARAKLEALDNGLPAYVRVYAPEQVDGLARLVDRFGFTPVRWFEELLRPLVDCPSPNPPAGLSLVPWDAAREDELLAIRNDAFADHWGSVPSSADDWDERVNGFGGRPDLSWMAVDDEGAVVGLCLNGHFAADEAVTGRKDGLIDSLGTRRDWRGRGVASALIAHSLRSFEHAGFTHALLEVDSASPTGAGRLYRALGFEPVSRVVVHEIPVASPAGGPPG